MEMKLVSWLLYIVYWDKMLMCTDMEHLLETIELKIAGIIFVALLALSWRTAIRAGKLYSCAMYLVFFFRFAPIWNKQLCRTLEHASYSIVYTKLYSWCSRSAICFPRRVRTYQLWNPSFASRTRSFKATNWH